jgi:hypothetical protein
MEEFKTVFIGVTQALSRRFDNIKLSVASGVEPLSNQGAYISYIPSNESWRHG